MKLRVALQIGTKPVRALMLLHNFPPLEDIASFRFSRLLRHLPTAGISPFVVSSALDGAFLQQEVQLSERVRVPVTRVKSWDPIRDYQKRDQRILASSEGCTPSSTTEARDHPLKRSAKKWVRSLLVPDDKFSYISGWAEAARSLGEFDVLYSSSSPYSAHLAARRVVKKTGVPWVLEMRDLWADSPYLAIRSNPLTLWLHRRWERQCVTDATRIVVLAPAHARHLSKRYPQFADKIRVVTNAIDVERNGSSDDPAPVPESGVIRLAHVGNLYGGRSLRTLVAAIDRRNAASPKVRWHLDIAGTSMDLPWSEVLGNSAAVTIHGRLSSVQVADLLATTQAGVVHNPVWDDVHIPGKLFDYLGAGLPIVNLTSQPDIEEIAGSCVPVVTAHSGEVDAIDRALVELAALLERGGGNPERLRTTAVQSRYSSSQLAADLAEVLREAATDG